MDELEFIRKCADLDKDSWKEFLRKYSRLIYSYIYSVIKDYPRLDADNLSEDVFQELIAALIKDNSRRLRSFKGLNGCSFASWIRLVTINFTRTFVEKQRYLTILDEDKNGLSGKDSIPDESISADEAALYREHAANLKECVDALGTDDRFLVQLHIDHGTSLESIRKVLNISRSAIDMRKNRLIKKLQDCFKTRGFV